MQISPFFHSLDIFFSRKLLFLWLIGNMTLCHPIRSEIILVKNKSSFRFAVVRFCESLDWLQTELGSTQSYYHYKSRESYRFSKVLDLVEEILIRKSYRSALPRFGFKTVERKQNEKGMARLSVTITIRRLNSQKRSSRWTQNIQLMSKKTRNWSK